MKKYKTGGSSWMFSFGRDLITEVDIIRETESTVWYLRGGIERRDSKKSGHAAYFDTREEAKEFLIEMAQKRYDRALNEYDAATKILKQVNDL